jgi:hypothetical protein
MVYMNENLGEKRCLSFHAVVVKANRPNKIIWQMMKFGIKLPAFVEFELQNFSDELLLKHELKLGFNGIGKLLDPIIKIYFNKSFQEALETHCNIEWYKLRDLLNCR